MSGFRDRLRRWNKDFLPPLKRFFAAQGWDFIGLEEVMYDSSNTYSSHYNSYVNQGVGIFPNLTTDLFEKIFLETAGVQAATVKGTISPHAESATEYRNEKALGAVVLGVLALIGVGVLK